MPRPCMLEIFRKYMRFKLNEEAFSINFVADVLALKRACGLNGDNMKNMLLESGAKMKYKLGPLQLDISAMNTPVMRDRKENCARGFAKLMYLAWPDPRPIFSSP